MSEPEGFLTRWSRRKLDPADKNAVEDPNAGPTNAEAKPQPPSDNAVAEFDVSKLPPLESIDATSDIWPFLQAGVPSALRHAALRRAWSADPAIRDFVGLNENFWDAVGMDAASGFGPLDPDFDVEKVVANLLGEGKPESPAIERTIDERDTSTAAELSEVDMQKRNVAPPNVPNSALQDRADNALLESNSKENIVSMSKRRHGGATPQ